MNFNKDKLAKRIKEIRKSKNLTQEELCGIMNFETSNYSNIETGSSTPTIPTLYKIVNALGISFNEIFEYEHLNSETILDELNLKIYKQLSLKKKQSLYKILRALEDCKMK